MKKKKKKMFLLRKLWPFVPRKQRIRLPWVHGLVLIDVWQKRASFILHSHVQEDLSLFFNLLFDNVFIWYLRKKEKISKFCGALLIKIAYIFHSGNVYVIRARYQFTVFFNATFLHINSISFTCFVTLSKFSQRPLAFSSRVIHKL